MPSTVRNTTSSTASLANNSERRANDLTMKAVLLRDRLRRSNKVIGAHTQIGVLLSSKSANARQISAYETT
jgi:hypothetical protein